MKNQFFAFRAFAVAVAVLFSFAASAQTMFWNEDFEDDGQAAGRYTTNSPTGGSFSDLGTDFFGTIPPLLISPNYDVSGQNNNGYFAAQDTDGDNAGFTTGIISFDDIDISNQTSLELRLLVAEDDDGSNQDWDAGDLLYVEVDFDNSGSFTKVLQFANDGSNFNAEPGQDTDFDGIRDGASLTDVFAEFTATLGATGSLLDINIVFDGMNNGDEDAAVDFLQLWGVNGAPVLGCTDPNATNYDANATQDDGSCMYANACNLPGTVVLAGNFYYNPQDLTIATGETVVWENEGGTHNVDGTTDVLSGSVPYTNPENFFIATAGVGCLGSYTFTVPGVYNYNCSIGSHAASGMVGTITVGVGGCTDTNATNYDAAAEFDDGSCVLPVIGCMDPAADNYDNTATTHDGSCDYTSILGNCTLYISEYGEGSSQNKFLEIYNPGNASMNLEFFAFPNANGGSDGTYEFWNSFPAGATVAAGDVYILADSDADVTITDAADSFHEFLSNGDDGYALVQGSQDNFVILDFLGDFGADPGSGWEVAGVSNATQNNTLRRKDTVGSGNDDWDASRGTDATDSEWEVLGNEIWTGLGAHTQTAACSAVPGCTDPAADNYDPLANEDDGSCIISGCTDNTALNFDPAANNDDGSCVFTLAEIEINEIMYNPCGTQGGDSDWEFIELHNYGATTVDLTGYTISNAIDHTFGAVSIAADEYIVLAVNAAVWGAQSYQVIQWDSGAINNTGETITLTDDNALVVDEVTYSSGAPWPLAANGSCSSLEQITEGSDNSDVANWQASYVDNGTPGAANSEAPAATPYTIQEIQTVATSGEAVSTSGIVTGIFAGQGRYTIQDGTGAYSGIWVEGSGVALGDEVDVFGTYIEAGGFPSFDLGIITNSTRQVLSSGNALPATEVLGTQAINDEQWEGVLVETVGTVTFDNAGFGEWAVNDGSGDIFVDDYGYDAIGGESIQLNDSFRVIGPLFFSFGAYKIAPRDLDDVLERGCTDVAFANYNAEAEEDDGNCSNATGCTDPNADNYDPLAAVDDGTCVTSGCTDDTALNYNIDADTDDGSCYFVLPAIVITEIFYDPAGSNDTEFEFVEVYNNGASSANLTDFTFTQGITFTFPDGTTLGAGEYAIIAVTAATYAGASCQVFEVDFDNLSNSGETLELQNGFGLEVDQVTYSPNSPWPSANDSSIELIDPNTDNNNGANWQGSTLAGGSPCGGLAGCTDSNASNYDPAASTDDGSCLVSGCTYDTADNYNPAATVEDGTCEFTLADPCPQDLDDNGSIGTSDLLVLLAAFGSDCADLNP